MIASRVSCLRSSGTLLTCLAIDVVLPDEWFRSYIGSIRVWGLLSFLAALQMPCGTRATLRQPTLAVGESHRLPINPKTLHTSYII